MTDLTADEQAALEIAASGESMAATGRWEKTIDALVNKGLLARFDKFNNSITQAGRDALAKQEDKNWESLAQSYAKVNHARVEIRRHVKAAVDALVAAALLTKTLKGDSPPFALEQWLSVVAQEAAERLKEDK